LYVLTHHDGMHDADIEPDNNDLDKRDDGVYIGLFAKKKNKKHETPASNWEKMKG
jgi:hypothetical protein